MKLRLVLALYAEGSTDKTFLGNVIPQTAVNILAKYGQQAVDVLGIDAKKDIGIKDGGQRILNAARQLALEHDNQYDEESATYPILIVHCDADAPDNKDALKNRYHPGYKLVQQSSELTCKSMIPVIPVRMIESWMLAAEHEMLQNVLRRFCRSSKSSQTYTIEIAITLMRQSTSFPLPISHNDSHPIT